ncbi:MAG: TIM barrel protein [Thermoplasmata archaeon]|nr:TIM barrel protein [Thermoplasmata archaeon]
MRDGIGDAHHLGLSALEVQFIKVNPLTRPVLDEEVGLLPRNVPLQLIVEVAPPGKDAGGPTIPDLSKPLVRRSNVTALTWSLAKDHPDLAQTKALGQALDVALTLHAPYYVDFFGSQESRDRSLRQIQWTGILAYGLGARLTVTHLGFYGGGDRAESIQELTSIAREVSQWLDKYTHGTVKLAIEPSGHADVYGSREEVLELARTVKGVVPVLNLPHIAARERIPLDNPTVLKTLFDEFVEASHGDVYANFSGVEMYGPGEFRLTPIKRGQLKFDPIADFLADREYDATVISSSPLLEHDAMYMKLLYERALSRRWARRHAPPKAVAAAAAAKAAASHGSAAKPGTKGAASPGKHGPPARGKPPRRVVAPARR